MDSRKPKRTKVTAACGACVKRKSRCELLTEEGCHRCRILGTACSLQQTDVPTGSYGGEASRERSEAYGEGEGRETGGRSGKRRVEGEEGEEWCRSRLEELEARLQVVESELESRRPRSVSLPPLGTGERLLTRRESPSTTTTVQDESLGRVMIKHPAPYTAIPELVGVDFETGWYDPIQRGLINEGQMYSAYLS
jgi:hypothetical protein